MISFVVDQCSFAPNGLHLACVIQPEKRMLIRSCHLPDKLRVELRFNISHIPVDTLAWSRDSAFIAAGCKKAAVINIYSVVMKHWNCKLTFGTVDLAGGIGLETFMWAPDARRILCVSNEYTFLSVWSIQSKCVQYIKAIAQVERGQTFSPNGSQLAVVHADDGVTNITVYSCKSWTKERRFPIACKDCAGISWCPSDDSNCIACWDSNLFSNVFIYDASKGLVLKQYSPYGLSSNGFKSIDWTCGGQFLVCTTQRNELHVLNGLTFGVFIHDVLEPTVAASTHDIFYEPSSEQGVNNKYLQLEKWPDISIEKSLATYSKDFGSSLLPSVLLPEKAVRVKLNSDGSYIACKTHIYPQVVWVYHLLSGRVVAVLIHQHVVLDFAWNPVSSKLAIICAQSPGLLYFWTTEGAAYIHRSRGIYASDVTASLTWSPHGNLLTVHDFDKMHVFSSPS